MSIEVTTPLIHKSLSSFLLGITPGANIYDNPNQQGTKIPAWFIVHRSPVTIVREIGRAWLTYEIDLYYMLQLNLPNTFDQYAAIADSLNTSFEYLTIFGTTSKIHVLERNWSLQLDCLKYSITLKLRVSRETVLCEKMRVIEDLQVFLKNQPVSPTYFIITVLPSENGVCRSNVSTALEGNTIVLTAVPNDSCTLQSLTVLSGSEVIETTLVDDDYLFVMPKHDVVVVCVFVREYPIEEVGYFSPSKSPVNFTGIGDHYVYGGDGSTFRLDPQFEYTPKNYVLSDDTTITIPSTLARKVYFRYGQGETFFDSWLMLYHYVYYVLNSVVSIHYEKNPAILYTAWVNSDKSSKTIDTNMSVYLYDEDGNQISIPTESYKRAVIVFYYNGDVKNSNFNGNSVKIRIIDNNTFRIRTSETLTIDKVEYSIQPVVSW